MGLPIERLIIATNVNDILHRTLQTGRYEVREVTATSSPSMDIQVSSNFERVLYEVTGRDAPKVRALIQGLGQSGAYTLDDDARGELSRIFASGSVDEIRTADTIARLRRHDGILVDPHTAVGVTVAEQHLGEIPMVTVATAHPSKFPDAVEEATGERPELPASAQSILSREEHYQVLPPDVGVIERAIETRLRATETVP
jgi:threonine synthase